MTKEEKIHQLYEVINALAHYYEIKPDEMVEILEFIQTRWKR